MSEQSNKNTDGESNVIEVELLAVDEAENYQGLTLKCILVYLVRVIQTALSQGQSNNLVHTQWLLCASPCNCRDRRSKCFP